MREGLNPRSERETMISLQQFTKKSKKRNKHLRRHLLYTSHGQVDILVQAEVAEIKPKREHLSNSQSKNVNTLNSCQNGEEPLTVMDGCVYSSQHSVYTTIKC